MQKSRGRSSPPLMFYRFLLHGPGALLALLLFTATPADAQEAERTALQEAFAAGDARAVMAHAAGRVEVSLFGSRSQYSRSQAMYVLQNFFEDHPPRRFSWRSMSANGRSRFLTGRYWHETAERPLPVYLRLSQGEGAWQLQEVRIDRR